MCHHSVGWWDPHSILSPAQSEETEGQQIPEQTHLCPCAEGLQQPTDLGVCSNSLVICMERWWFCCRTGVLCGFGASADGKLVSLTPLRQ